MNPAVPLRGHSCRPRTLADTGLPRQLVIDLIVKQLYEGGTATLAELVAGLALPGAVVEPLIDGLRHEAAIEVRAGTQGKRYLLTDRGRVLALDALARSGYVGPAPVPVLSYGEVATAQGMRRDGVNPETMRAAFDDVVVDDDLLAALGPAVVSGRAVFVYGPAGTGKTYLTQRLHRLFDEPILVPHAIAVNETVIQYFDPLVHKPVGEAAPQEIMLERGHDPRFILCERPIVMVGGELTLDMLDLAYDADTRTYQAPLQLKANNGLMIVDDLGRQRMRPMDLLNRWIVPLEERRDFLSLGAGRQFSVPFDVALIFSTNMNPLELADEAFLRRIGYKIRFATLSPQQYGLIWRDVCARSGIDFDPAVLAHVVDQLHARDGVPLLPCHPRDLLGIADTQRRYLGRDAIDCELIDTAWQTYFVQLDESQYADSELNTGVNHQ